MPRRSKEPLELDAEEFEDLMRLRSSTRAEQRLVQRAGIILEAAAGGTAEQIGVRAGVCTKSVYKWTARYCQRREAEPKAGVRNWLADADRVGTPGNIEPEVWVDLLALVTSEPRDSGRPITHWTHRELADELVVRRRVQSIAHTSVGRFLSHGQFKPHRVRGWMNRKHDPQFDARATEIKHLVVQATTHDGQTGAVEPAVQQSPPAAQSTKQAPRPAAVQEPPRQRVVASFDEKTGMQAKERIAADKPLRSGSPAKLEFEYKRNGTLCLFALMIVHSGLILGCTGPTRTNEDTAEVLGVFLKQLLDAGHKRIDLILDGLNTHWSVELVELVARLCHLPLPSARQMRTGTARRAWLSDPTHAIVFHFTPKHASWLNPIECWFGILVRKVLRRGSFRSTTDLAQQVAQFIAYYNEKLAHPFKFKLWTRPAAATPQQNPCRVTSRRPAA
jgi:transposase